MDSPEFLHIHLIGLAIELKEAAMLARCGEEHRREMGALLIQLADTLAALSATSVDKSLTDQYSAPSNSVGTTVNGVRIHS